MFFNCFLHSNIRIHSFNTYSLSAYYVLDVGEIRVNDANKIATLREVRSRKEIKQVSRGLGVASTVKKNTAEGEHGERQRAAASEKVVRGTSFRRVQGADCRHVMWGGGCPADRRAG